MTAGLRIRPLEPADRAGWDGLWAGYLAFYRASDLPPAVTEATWQRFFDPAAPMAALVAEADGRLVGFAHYLFHLSTWAARHYCYLEDLFTAPDARGQGVGRALIETVGERALQAGAERLYWLTHDTNTDAQALYDRVGRRSGFIQYVR